ncbi:MAG: Verru_Chthon cassette protein B [Rhodospirillales bacterium]|nr:Verru_Chthon cassette protein B [Acetobacter sp.]
MRQPSIIPSSRSSRRPRHEHAFTLVEVTLAFGIAATALLVVFSLIPLGLSSLQDSGRQIVETEIYNKIGSELAAASLYDDSSSTSRVNVLSQQYCLTRFPAYFDAEGNELKKTDGGTPPTQTVFTVRCVCGGQGSPDPIANVWGKAGTGELVAATVNIGFHQDPGQTPVASTNIHARTFLLSNHGS